MHPDALGMKIDQFFYTDMLVFRKINVFLFLDYFSGTDYNDSYAEIVHKLVL